LTPLNNTVFQMI